MKSLQLSISSNIPCEVVKLLGIDIDFRLSFDNHISNICKKKNKRKKKKKSSTAIEYTETNWEPIEQTKQMSIWYTFILSNFIFCPLAWHFCSKGNTKRWKKYKSELLDLYMNILAVRMKIS